MTGDKPKAFYCVSTHWDREWYETFQEFRMWLVEVIDELLDIMEAHSEFRCFHLDGQAIVLKDYLRIRPENQERLLKLMRAGRILAGPWHVLPDEWLVSGESFVRNIQLGMRTCREYGVEPMSFAYTPDQFGHIAALPMLMTGMGLKGGIVWRGTTDEDFAPQFIWEGPDGSQMITHKLFDEAAYGWLFHRTRVIDGTTDYADPKFQAMIDQYITHERGRVQIPTFLILDGNDHQHAGTHMIDLFEGMQEKYPDIEFVWGSLPEYAADVAQHADKLDTFKGELRAPCRDQNRACQYLIVHTISSRYTLKQRNDQCQGLLEKWAEPYALFRQLAGGSPVLRYLDEAWEYVIENHPHDSICGCSIDQVHRDMMYRFDQAEEIADGVIRRAIASVGGASDADAIPQPVVVHNPLPFRRHGVVNLALSMPHGWPKVYADGLSTAESINKFALVTKSGERLPFQLNAIERGIGHKRIRSNGRFVPRGGDVYHLAVEMDLPSCGYTGFSVEPIDDAVRNIGTLRTGPLSASTGGLTLTMNPDGTACLEHPASGRVFEGLFLYEDCGDGGDGWTYGRLVRDLVFRSTGSQVEIAVEEDGLLRTVFRVERSLKLPRGMERPSRWRSEDRTTLKIVDRIHVEKDAEFIRVQTTVNNTCLDHRLRVLFPSHIASDVSFAETPFAMVERDIPIPPESIVWHERVNPEKAFTNCFGIQDGAGGLAVIAPHGLHEYEVTETPDRSLALTLFRATQQTVGTAGEPDGQLQGDLEFEYMLMPFTGSFDPVHAGRVAAECQAGVKWHTAAELPDDQSFLAVEGNDVLVTAIKPSERLDGVPAKSGIVRMWNPADQVAEVSIKPTIPVQAAHRCNLAEEPQEALQAAKDGVTVSVPARGLATVRLDWA